jgi:hypothetical protein
MGADNITERWGDCALTHKAPIDPVRVFRGWLREAVRLARLAASTGRAIHAKALQRHLEAMSFHTAAIREELP